MADYLSQAVLVGYIAGVAIVLIIGQIGKLTGIPSADGNALRELWGYLTNLGAANPATLAVGLGSMVILVVMRRLLPTWPSALIVVVAGHRRSLGLGPRRPTASHWSGPFPAGLPPLEIPAVGLADVRSLVVPAIGIFLVSFSDAILISRAIAAKNHETVDANQELFAFGTANISAGLTAGMPIGASGSRTAVNDSMQVTSQVGGLVNALAVALILLFLTEPIQYLPTAVLAAIIIVASVGIIEASAWVTLRRSSRAEVLIAVVTMVLVLSVGVLQALFVAVFLSMADVVRRVANPHDAVQGFVPSIDRFGNVDSHPDAEVIHGIVIYRLDDRIFFANCQRVNGRIWSAISGAPKPVRWLVFDVAGCPRHRLRGPGCAPRPQARPRQGGDRPGLRDDARDPAHRPRGGAGPRPDRRGQPLRDRRGRRHRLPGADGGRGRIRTGHAGWPPTTPATPAAPDHAGARDRRVQPIPDRLLAEVGDPSRRVQAHRRGGGQVEALRAAEDRDPDDVVHGREHLVRAGRAPRCRTPRRSARQAGPRARR